MRSQGNLQPVAVIGAGLDLGAGRARRRHGPAGDPVRRPGGEDRAARPSLRRLGERQTAVAEASAVGDERVRFLPQIKAACERIAEQVARAMEESFVPLVLGGDHSVALGTLGGLARESGLGGVLWLDAHGDLNRPETSPSGNVHGMPLARTSIATAAIVVVCSLSSRASSSTSPT